MKKLILVALVTLTAFVYFNSSSKAAKAVVSKNPIGRRPIAAAIVVASNSSYSDRWRTGANAQTDLQTGANAQTSFEPFAPLEQANWNQTPGYTIIAGRHVK
ncbi:MAG: hypothetical protein M3Y86_09795 [Verrucomicrobiota bacterium]|nr:hypothetical protein [Verrucomicrobiota bacterium]